ncbi:MAG: acyl carrier protein [Clostridiales bacterium]|nr:acyl carrier protein [Clostridiales bacterium]
MLMEFIREQLALQLNVEEDAVWPDTRFDELGADAVDIVELVMALEAEYGVLLEDEQLERVQTVGDLIKLVEES